MVKEVAEGLFGFRGQGGFSEGVVHQRDPAVAGADVDGETAVAHAEAGMAALLDISGGAAEAEDEELAEAGFGAVEIGGGVHGAEDVIGGNLPVERVDQTAETIVANGLIDLVFGEGEGHIFHYRPGKYTRGRRRNGERKCAKMSHRIDTLSI